MSGSQHIIKAGMLKCFKILTADLRWGDLNLSRREEGSGRPIEGSEPVLSIIGDGEY